MFTDNSDPLPHIPLVRRTECTSYISCAVTSSPLQYALVDDISGTETTLARGTSLSFIALQWTLIRWGREQKLCIFTSSQDWYQPFPDVTLLLTLAMGLLGLQNQKQSGIYRTRSTLSLLLYLFVCVCLLFGWFLFSPFSEAVRNIWDNMDKVECTTIGTWNRLRKGRKFTLIVSVQWLTRAEQSLERSQSILQHPTLSRPQDAAASR